MKKHLNTLIVGMTLFSGTRASHDLNCHVALALDPEFGALDQFTSLSPDFMIRHPGAFKAQTKGNDPDIPNIVHALSGPHHEEFLEAMKIELEELEGHQTWEAM